MNLLPSQLRPQTRVLVFDPEDRNLRLVAISQLDRPFQSHRKDLSTGKKTD